MKLKIFSGLSNPALTTKVCNYLSCKMGEIEHHKFPSGEWYCQFGDNIRGNDVFLIQSICSPVNDNLMQLLIMADAARRASAGRITAVIPYLGYARQDRKDKSRVPISSKLVVDMIINSGVDRIISVDLHAPSIQGFTNKPFDNLYAMSALIENCVKTKKEIVIVAPDAGAVKRYETFAKVYKTGFAFIAKQRLGDEHVETNGFVGNIRNKIALICDDLSESCGTLINAAKVCREQGAIEVYALVSHSLFTKNGFERLRNDNQITKIITTNTVPLIEECDKIQIIDIGWLIAESIKRTHLNESVSELFQIKGF